MMMQNEHALNETTLLANFDKVQRELTAINQQTQGKAALLAVSKTKPAAQIRTLFGAGQRAFGENYLQEAIAKMDELADLPIQWHYIGSIQRNKTRDIAKYFDWVQTLDRAIIADRLNEQRGDLPPLNVLIQVNIDDEASKSGCLPAEVAPLIEHILGCEKLVLRGLMVIPSKDGSDAFVRTRQLFDEMAARFDLPNWDSISMGMSGDMAAAVAAGSTMVRVGTAIFGERNYQNK